MYLRTPQMDMNRKSDSKHKDSHWFKTKFMKQMDGIVKDNTETPLLVIACTNCPGYIDSAILL